MTDLGRAVVFLPACLLLSHLLFPYPIGLPKRNNTMPARAADLDEALQKKGGLTLSQLANYDDLITDALVDRVSPTARTAFVHPPQD